MTGPWSPDVRVAQPKTGLVLAGGGARGAYEAGVLRFIYADLAPRLPVPANMDIICGTSAGALNGTWLAGNGGTPSGMKALSELWQRVKMEDFFSIRALKMLSNPSMLWSPKPDPDASSVLDASGFHAQVHARFPWKGLQERLRAGTLTALVISTTEVATGSNVLFVQHREGHFPGFIPSPQVQVRHTTLGPDHILASSAIPFLFPPVQLDGHYFVDGSLRQNTPLAPALRLGADRVLVIGVKRTFAQRNASQLPPDADKPPGLAFLMGKALNALTLDPIEQEFGVLQRYNSLFRWGAEAYGEDFLERLNTVVVPMRGAAYRPVEALMIRPREDLGRVAAQCYRDHPPQASAATRMFLSLLADKDADEADMLSFLLFDGGYTGEVERLGWEDARDREEELAAFFLSQVGAQDSGPTEPAKETS